MKNLKKKVAFIVTTISMVVFNVMLTLATAIDPPTLNDVKPVVDEGLDMLFGIGGAFCCIGGAFSIVEGLNAYKDSKRKGGFGKGRSNAMGFILGGIAGFVAGLICFAILAWTKDLFHL